MICCDSCKRSFFDGEVISFRIVKSTEHPFHTECLGKILAAEALLADIFGGEPDPAEVFTRTYRRSQVAAKSEFKRTFE